jgi:hypothetical protein
MVEQALPLHLGRGRGRRSGLSDRGGDPQVVARPGGYYLGTGVTPFISRRAFEAVTGPKKEWWPVETVGLLVTAVGAGLATAAARDRVTPEITIVAAGCAGGLAAIDIVYVARGASRPRTWPMPRPRCAARRSCRRIARRGRRVREPL